MSATTSNSAAAASNADVADALASLPDDTLRCRYYEQQYPDVEDIVVVQVKSIAEMGAYVSLLEYNDVEGMILLSELSRRRIRSITKLIRVGRIEFVVVLRVDKEKGYIDLSKRRVAPEDVAKADKKYTKAKAVHSLLRHIAQLRHVKLEDLYKQVAWPLARTFGHAYEAFKLAIVEPEKVFVHLPDLPADLKDQLLKEILERLTPQAVRVRADVEVTCFAYEGIDAVKAALRAAIAAQTEHMPVKVKLLAPPHYVMWCAAIDKEAGIELLEKAISRAEAVIKEKNGELVVKIAPRAVTERDAELTRIDEEEEEETESGSE